MSVSLPAAREARRSILRSIAARRLTAPFQRLAEAARGEGRAEAFVGGPREAAEAARALDAMRDRLGEA